MGKGKAILRNSRSQANILSLVKRYGQNGINSYQLSNLNDNKISYSQCYRHMRNLEDQGLLYRKGKSKFYPNYSEILKEARRIKEQLDKEFDKKFAPYIVLYIDYENKNGK